MILHAFFHLNFLWTRIKKSIHRAFPVSRLLPCLWMLLWTQCMCNRHVIQRKLVANSLALSITRISCQFLNFIISISTFHRCRKVAMPQKLMIQKLEHWPWSLIYFDLKLFKAGPTLEKAYTKLNDICIDTFLRIISGGGGGGGVVKLKKTCACVVGLAVWSSIVCVWELNWGWTKGATSHSEIISCMN